MSASCSGSLSRGGAATRIVVGVLVAVLLIVVAVLVFPSREKRLWSFVDSCRDALLAGREEDFMAKFAPSVRYQSGGGTVEIRRDFKRYRSLGVPQPTFTSHAATFDAEGADVVLDVLLTVALRPLGQFHVRMHATDAGGEWRLTDVRWE